MFLDKIKRSLFIIGNIRYITYNMYSAKKLNLHKQVFKT